MIRTTLQGPLKSVEHCLQPILWNFRLVRLSTVAEPLRTCKITPLFYMAGNAVICRLIPRLPVVMSSWLLRGTWCLVTPTLVTTPNWSTILDRTDPGECTILRRILLTWKCIWMLRLAGLRRTLEVWLRTFRATSRPMNPMTGVLLMILPTDVRLLLLLLVLKVAASLLSLLLV